MASYVTRRLMLMIVTLFGISIIIFFLLRVVPGNIVDILFDSAGMVNPAEKVKIERELGLDRPIPVQYLAWIGGIAQGDLGYSYVSEKPAIDEIAPRIPVTAKLASSSPGSCGDRSVEVGTVTHRRGSPKAVRGSTARSSSTAAGKTMKNVPVMTSPSVR